MIESHMYWNTVHCLYNQVLISMSGFVNVQTFMFNSLF